MRRLEERVQVNKENYHLKKKDKTPNINVQCMSRVKTFSGILPGNEVLDILSRNFFHEKKNGLTLTTEPTWNSVSDEL